MRICVCIAVWLYIDWYLSPCCTYALMNPYPYLYLYLYLYVHLHVTDIVNIIYSSYRTHCIYICSLYPYTPAYSQQSSTLSHICLIFYSCIPIAISISTCYLLVYYYMFIYMHMHVHLQLLIWNQCCTVCSNWDIGTCRYWLVFGLLFVVLVLLLWLLLEWL